MSSDNPSIPGLSDDDGTFIEGVLDLAREGRTGPLLEMIRSGVPVNLSNARGDTALILAAYHQHVDTVGALLDAVADTGRINAMGQTALSAAVFRNSKPIVRTLLDAGANPSLGAHTAMEIARQFGLTEMQKLLEEHAEGRG